MTDDKPAAVAAGTKPANDGPTQSERFMQAAQELKCADDPERVNERVRNPAKPSKLKNKSPLKMKNLKTKD